MQSIDTSTWLSQAAVEKLGWVLVHSFWQLTAVALLAWLSDRALRRTTSSVRYLSLLFTLLLMIASPVVTWLMLPASPVDPVSAAKPDSASMARDTPAQTVNQEPAAPIETADVSTSGSLDQPVATSASSRHWMNRCAEFLTPWLGTIVSVWSFGVLMFSVRPVVSWLNVQRLKRRGTSAVSESVQQTLAMLSQKLQVRQRVDVLISTVVTSPIVVGCFRSVVLLPATFIAGVPPAQLEAILAHELAHVKRYDYFVNLIQTLVETLFFYHPAVWWLSHRIRIERENCCDDMVVTALNNKVDYGRALLAIEELRGQVSALALSANGGSLVARVKRLFCEPVHDGSQTAAGILSCGTLLAILMLAMMWPRAIARDETPIGTEKPNIVENEPPRGSCENGKSVSFVGIRICGAPNDHWWWPNGRESVVKEGRWSPSSTDYGPKGRDFLFDFSGFGRCPSLRVRTPSLGQENYIDQVDQTIQQSDRLLDYSQITEFDGFVEPSTAKVWITDEPWGPWLQVETDGDLLNPIDMNDTFNRIYSLIKASPVINDGKFIRPAISFSWPANFAEFVDFEFRAIGSDGADIDCSQSFEETGLTFTVRESHDTAQQFSHFEFRLRPYRYLTTFRNIEVDGPTDSPSQVKVEVKKLTDSEILAALTSTSPQQKPDEGNDESKRTVSVKADVNQAPSALKDQIVATFKNDAELNERLKLAMERAAGEDKRIAIVIAKPDSQQADWFYSLLQGTADDLKRWKVDESAITQIRQNLPRFQLLWVDAAQFDELRQLIPDHEFEDQHESSMVFLESDGSWLCHFEPDPMKEPRRSLENLGSALDLHKEGKK